MAISRPLDKKAVRAADQQFYERYPEMVDKSGKRIPLSAKNDPDNEMHEDWVRFYKAHASGKKGPKDPAPPDDEPEEEEEGRGGRVPPGDGVDDFPTRPPAPCPDCPNSWISIDLMYADQENCTGVRYRALLTNSYQEPSTSADKTLWKPIPAGTCLFGDFEFHKDGRNAVKPRL